MPEPEAPTRSRALRAHALRLARTPEVAAAVLFALAALAYLRPSLLGGDVLAPTGLLYEFSPWRWAVPPDLHDWYNNFVSDAALQFSEWHRYARDALRSGTFPEWNPYVLAGAPFAANAQAGLFTPFHLPIWILPFVGSMAAVAALKVWVAGMGAWLLARELGTSFWPAALAGAAFAFCSFELVWLQHPHTTVAPLLPWAIWLTERILRRESRWAAPALAAALAVAFLGGHPGTKVHVLLAVAIYAVVRTAALRPGDAPRRLVTVAAASALGVVTSAVASLPSYLVVPGSTGEAIRDAEEMTIPGESLVTLAFPDWWGRPSHALLPDFNFAEQSIHVGAIALVLAAIALLTKRGWRDKAAFAVLGVLGLLVALGVPPVSTIVEHTPALGDVRNARMTLYTQLALAILAALGLQRVLDERGAWRVAWPAIGAAAVVAVVAVVQIAPTTDEAKATREHFLEGTDFVVEPVMRLTAVGWWALLVGALALSIGLARRWPRIAIGVLAVAVVVDVTHFVNGYQPQGPAARVYPPDPPVIGALRTETRDGRMVAVGGATFPADTNMRYRLRDPRGYDPPDPTLEYSDLWLLAAGGERSDGLNLAGLTAEGRRVIDLLGVRAIYTAGELPEDGGLKRVYTGLDGSVYRNPQARPRAFVPTRVETAPDAAAARRTMMDPAFDGRTSAVVDEKPAHAGLGTVRIVRDEFSEVELRADMQREGLVVLTESLRDGWSVKVDGRDADPMRVDTVLRGVVVPAGAHTITWTYKTPGLRIGALLSLLGALGIAGWAARLLRRPWP